MSCTQLHRVVNPNTEAMRQADRNTIVYFLHPDADFIIRCLDGSDTFEPVTDDTYYAKREDETLRYKAQTAGFVSSQNG